MTWKECRDAALRKMFAARGGQPGYENDWEREYLAAMPNAANEAMHRICDSGVPLRKTLELQVENTGGGQLFDMRALATDYKGAGRGLKVMVQKAEGVCRVNGAQVMMNRFLLLPRWVSGKVTVEYDGWPEEITAVTEDEHPMPLAPNANALIPLYLAGELYKDEDLAAATIFMNEFEARLGSLAAQESTDWGDSFLSRTGWC